MQVAFDCLFFGKKNYWVIIHHQQWFMYFARGRAWMLCRCHWSDKNRTKTRMNHTAITVIVPSALMLKMLVIMDSWENRSLFPVKKPEITGGHWYFLLTFSSYISIVCLHVCLLCTLVPERGRFSWLICTTLHPRDGELEARRLQQSFLLGFWKNFLSQ